ncbi:MAG: hypothetical protein HFACDABA_01341 [Anaerolineales bacterium]|nr:hypothetical protein [Anaerolineales bacterium]
MPNHLASESSPYLLQHAHNPVDWYPWGDEALARARAEDKPIFLSIGYAACHWCHVMAHESFEDNITAAYMNERFVNIKVDREQRPDLDGIYMAAVVALTGSGGWPMSVFLTPDLRPFYGGTYFPPAPRYNMPSFRDVLTSLADAWTNQRDEIERVGAQLKERLMRQSATQTSASTFTPELLAVAEKNLVDSYDWGYGGWGAAPKFPQTMAIEFLLARAAMGGEVEGAGSRAALHALQAMARGGMYDVVGGGFSRYSVDTFWRVPHFEKMLYDNALLARAYLHAWQISGDPFYRRIVEETLDFAARELTHPDGGFYSSLDADSEGEEGKFYVWTKEEIREALFDNSEIEFFEAAYGITDAGNWEGKTVLQRTLDDASLATRFKINVEAVPIKLAECHVKLLSARSKRIRPGTDDKMLTAWNGLMLAAFAEAARVLGDHTKSGRSGMPHHERYYELAARNAAFILSRLRPDGILRRSWRDGQTTHEVFLEDYAALILGLLELYQTDFNNQWFVTAMDLADEMTRRFNDPTGGFFDTPGDGETLLVRPKDTQDNATPSGNALAAEALLKLAALTGRGDLRDLGERALGQVARLAVQYPTGFARWLWTGQFAAGKIRQVALILNGDEQNEQALTETLFGRYRPNSVTAATRLPVAQDAPALLHDRPLVNGLSAAYVCDAFACLQPATAPEELSRQLES